MSSAHQIVSGAVQYLQPAAQTYAQPIYSQTFTQPQPSYTYQTAPAAYQTAPAAYQTAPAVTYSAPVTYTSPVTYSQALPQEAGVTYTTAPQVTYAAPQIVSQYAGVPGAYVQQPQYTQQPQYPQYQVQQFPQAESMIAYANMPRALQQIYAPTCVQAAWDNHFGAIGTKDLDKIMLDYDDFSAVQVYHSVEGTLRTYQGPAQIREMFAGMFSTMDATTVNATVCKVEEEPKTVFLCWENPASGVKSATDTFLFDEGLKIRRQNVHITSCPATFAAAVTSATKSAAAAVTSATAKKESPKKESSKKETSKKESSSKKDSKDSKKSSKKKAKGCC